MFGRTLSPLLLIALVVLIVSLTGTLASAQSSAYKPSASCPQALLQRPVEIKYGPRSGPVAGKDYSY
ncbi:hypothetical protein JCM11491_000592 [Sporobolomyces phaffii]